MSMLFSDGNGSSHVGGAEPLWRRVARRPLVVLVLGLLASAVVMLTLFGPFYRETYGPGRLLAWRLLDADGPASFLPDKPQYQLHEHPFAFLLILSVIVLALVPWGIAGVRRRTAQRSQAGGPRPDSATRSSSTSRSGTTSHAGFSISTRVTRERRETSVEFTDDGRIERSGGAVDGAVRYSVEDLRSMAHVAGIPWKSAYETEGGARGFLEILRAVQTGASPVPATEDPAATGAEAEARAGAEAGRGAGGTDAASSSGSAAAGTGTSTSSSTAGPFSSASASSSTSSTSWSSDFTSSGSVYTPTSLYDAERAERTVLGTDPGEDDSTEASR